MTVPEDERVSTVGVDEISRQLSCALCRGYLIDCVAAEECGHVCEWIGPDQRSEGPVSRDVIGKPRWEEETN